MKKRTLICDIFVDNFDIYDNIIYYNTDQDVVSNNPF